MSLELPFLAAGMTMSRLTSAPSTISAGVGRPLLALMAAKSGSSADRLSVPAARPLMAASM